MNPVNLANHNSNNKPADNSPTVVDGVENSATKNDDATIGVSSTPKTVLNDKPDPLKISSNQKEIDKILETTPPPDEPKNRKVPQAVTVADLHRPKAVSQAEASFTKEELALMKPLRTYQSDVAALIKEKETDVVKINTAEQKRKEEKRQEIAKLPKEKRPPPPRPPQNIARLATVVSIILVLLGGGILGAIWYLRPTYSEVTFQVPTTIIPYDKKVVLDLSGREGKEVTNIFTDQVSQIEAPISSVIYFEIVTGIDKVKSIINFDDLLNKLDSEIPEPLRRALGKRFMAGALVFDGVKPFIIFTTDYFDIAFPGMLDWEAYLYRDFGALLGTASQNIPITVPTSTTSLLNQLILGPGFSDKVITNRDTRVLTDINGQTILVYSFLDKNTIIITPDEVVFKEILNKFLNTQLIR